MNLHQLQWSTVEAPLPPETEIIDAGLDRYNREAADLDAVRNFACFARAKSGEVVGGAIARCWGRCCELLHIWVAEEQRSKGIGRRLVGQVEEYAHSHEASIVYLDTFSFQAPEFYRSLGYQVVCEFEGFPDGMKKYIMRKVIG